MIELHSNLTIEGTKTDDDGVLPGILWRGRSVRQFLSGGPARAAVRPLRRPERFSGLEFNFGVGIGATRGTDHLLVKMIVGYRFGKKN